MNAAPLGFVVHVGDLTSGAGPCTDAWMQARARQFARIAHPVVVLPGDNDWVDCHRSGFSPGERLAAWRRLFCHVASAVGIERQSALDPAFPEFCEHVRWRDAGWLFVGLNLPGSNNNLGRAVDADAEHRRRMRAVGAWLRDAFARARAPDTRGLVIFAHADPMFEAGTGGAHDGYAGFRTLLAERIAATGKPVTYVHGDGHLFRDDRPLPGLRRIEVYGSPFVRWLLVSVGPDGTLDVTP